MAKQEITKYSNKNNDKKEKFVWTKKRKIAAGVIGAGVVSLIVFAIIIAVFDLGPLKEIARTEEEAKVVGECAGYDVHYDELRYITLLYRDELDAKYGKYDTLSADKKAEYEKELASKVASEMNNNYVILALCDKYGIDTNSKEARNYVKESLEDLVDEIGSREKYNEWLEKNNLTDALVRLIYKVDYLESALLEELTINGEVVEYTAANLDQFVSFVMEEEIYAKVIYVYYPRRSALYQDPQYRYSGMDEGVNDAIKLLGNAKSDSERYSTMKSLIGGAPYVQGYSVEGIGSYITYGQMHEDFEKATFALEDWECSDVVELDEGCYIIMRMPKERDEVARKAYELVEYYRYAVLKQLKDAQEELVVFDGNEYFDSINLIEVK